MIRLKRYRNLSIALENLEEPQDGSKPVDSEAEIDTTPAEATDVTNQADSLNENEVTGDSTGVDATPLAHDTAPATDTLFNAISAAAEPESEAGGTSAEHPFGTEGTVPEKPATTELSDGTEVNTSEVNEVNAEVAAAEITPPVEEAPPVTEDVDSEAEIDSETPDASESDADGIDEEDSFETEDLDPEVTEDQAAEAEAIADEVAEAEDADAVQAIDEENTIEEIEEDVAAVERYSTVLEMGLKRKQFSPQYLMAANSQLQMWKDSFGDQPCPAVPSLEDFNENDLEAAYTASLESFRGFLKRFRDMQTRLGQGVMDYWRKGGLVRKIESRAAAINKNADVASQKITESDIQGAKEIKGISADLSSKSGNLIQGIQADLKTTTAMASKGLQANEKFLVTVTDTLLKAINTGGVGKVEELLRPIDALKSPVSAYPPSVFDGSMLGGVKLDKAKEGSGDSIKDEIPSPGREKVERIKEAKLTKGDLVNLLKFAKVYTGIAQDIAKKTGVPAAERVAHAKNLRSQALDDNAQATSWNESKRLDYLTSDLPSAMKRHIEVYKFTAGHALDVAEALVTLVRKAL